MKNDFEKLVELFNRYGKEEDSGWYEMFYTNDYPVPYKGLLLHPIKISLYYIFHSFVECLLLPHLTSGDVEAISRTYFEYLVFLIEKRSKQVYCQELFELLSMSLHEPIFNEDGKPNICIIKDGNNHLLKIGNTAYNSKDFDIIRKIICEQNAIELPDEETHPEILQAYKDLEEYRRKSSKFKMCGFEDQISVVVAKTSYKKEECLNMTIRFFNKLFKRIDKIENFEVYTSLSPYLDKKGQDSIEYYLAAEKTKLEQMQDAQLDPTEVSKNFTSGVEKQ